MGRDRLIDEGRIRKFIELSLRRKIPPTIREISKYFNISVGTAHRYLTALRKKSLIGTRRVAKRQRSVARGIQLKNK